MTDVIEKMARAMARGNWPFASDAEIERAMPKWDSYAQAAYTAMMQHLEQDLALTEIANIEGASADWLEGFRFAVSRIAAASPQSPPHKPAPR